MAKQTKAELETRLASVQRERDAFFEWFILETREPTPFVLDVQVNGSTPVRVTVRGFGRASGGVAVVSLPEDSSTFRDAPDYLDDLIARWSRDSAWEIRDAARRLSAARNAANTVEEG